MNAKRIIIILVIIAVLAAGYFYFNKEEKPNPPVIIDSKKIATDPSKGGAPAPTSAPPASKDTTPPPKPSPNMVGRQVKSRGKNKFEIYETKDVAQDILQPQGTYKRIIVPSFVKVKGLVKKRKYEDGDPIGFVSQATDSGFFVPIGDSKYIWANKDLLIG